MLLGMPADVTLDLTGLWHRETELKGAYTYGTETLPDGRTTRTFDLALDTVAAVRAERLLSATYSLADHVDAIVAMLACHRSQVYEWLPYLAGVLDQVPGDEAERLAWLREWFGQHVRPRADRFREALVAAYGPQRGPRIEYCEAYEISEYAAAANEPTRRRLFPRE